MEPRQDNFDEKELRGCDESKCVSLGMSSLHDSSFTCYGDDGSFFPMMCADGFLPVVVENDVNDAIENGGHSLSYFTCCPPHPEEAVDPTRHCSDPITPEFPIHGNETASGICDDFVTWKHPRRMKASDGNSNSFLCCDSEAATEDWNNTTLADAFLDELECVPYRNDHYERARVRNKIGKLDVAFCALDEFEFARPINDAYGNDLVSNGGWYQCCKTGPSLPPFSKDTAFDITVYTTIVLFWIAAILSAIVAIGLLIPLLIELQKGRWARLRTSIASKSFHVSIFGSSFSGGSSSAGDPFQNSSRGLTSRRTARKTTYSSFNLYLVYLAFLDLIFSSYSIWEYQRYINQSFDIKQYLTIAVSPPCLKDANTFRDEPVVAPYMFANLWINAFICHEVFVLLRTSYSMRRIKQPSLTKVNLQAGGSCLVGTAWGIFGYLLYEPAWEARNTGDFGPLEDLDSVIKPITYLVLFGLPLYYVIYVTILILWRSYIPSVSGANARKRAMRELAFYFFRIVTVFIGIWLPRGILIFWADRTGQKWPDLVAQYVVAIQPILTTCVVLTKSDAKKYILDLVTMSYIFGDSTWQTKRTASKTKEQDETNIQSGNAAGTGTGTGFSLELDRHVDENAEEDGDSDSDRDKDEAADSLIFSVLGFRRDESSGRNHGSNTDPESGGDDAVAVDNIADGTDIDANLDATQDADVDA